MIFNEKFRGEIQSRYYSMVWIYIRSRKRVYERILMSYEVLPALDNAEESRGVLARNGYGKYSEIQYVLYSPRNVARQVRIF